MGFQDAPPPSLVSQSSSGQGPRSSLSISLWAVSPSVSSAQSLCPFISVSLPLSVSDTRGLSLQLWLSPHLSLDPTRRRWDAVLLRVHALGSVHRVVGGCVHLGAGVSGAAQ